MPTLRDTEFRVLVVLIRSTTGWNREGVAVRLSYGHLKRRTGRSSEAIANALRSLHGQGLIHITSRRAAKMDRKSNTHGSESEHHI